MLSAVSGCGVVPAAHARRGPKPSGGLRHQFLSYDKMVTTTMTPTVRGNNQRHLHHLHHRVDGGVRSRRYVALTTAAASSSSLSVGRLGGDVVGPSTLIGPDSWRSKRQFTVDARVGLSTLMGFLAAILVKSVARHSRLRTLYSMCK